MTRMADPERPRGEFDDDERFEDEGRRSIFSALWFRAILVVVVLGVVAAVAVPYILEFANQPATKPTVVMKPEMTPPPAPVAPPTPPPAAVPTPRPAVERPPAIDKPPAEKPSVAEKPAPVPSPMTPAAPGKPPVVAKRGDAAKSPVAKEPSARSSQAPASSGGAGDYFVQVGAFKNQETAKRLATRLRELKYSVQESPTSAAGSGRGGAASSSASEAPVGGDKYDVYVTGGALGDINAKLAAKGLSSDPSGNGVVVRPSLPLRDAVALSKDLAVDGLKVQVRRAAAGASAGASARPAPSTGSVAAPSSDGLYRVRVGPFDDRAAAVSTLRELEQRGYSPFLARGGQ